MANQSRLISAGTNYYIEGGGEYNGSGTPWTSSNGSPYEIAMNTVAGSTWTPLAAVRQEVYGGGPPFRNGSTLIYDSYGNVTETVTIQCRATSHDNAVFLLRQLRQILNTALFTAPCVLAVQPDGATNAVYYEIYGADVQEDARFVNEEASAVAAGHALVRAVVTWRRSPHGGPASLTTLFTNTTFTNNGSSNTASLGATAGDLLYEGQPINLKIDGPSASTTDVGKLWLSTCKSRVKTTHTTVVGTTTTTASALSTADTDASSLLTNSGINLAIFVRFSSVTAGNKALFALLIQMANGGGQIVPRTAWMPMPVTTGTSMLYAGIFNLAGQRVPNAASLTLEYSFFVKSTDGTSVGYTVDYSENVFAHTVAEVTASTSEYGNGLGILYSTRAQNLNGAAWLPLTPAVAYTALAGGVNPQYAETVRGVLPLAYSSGLLWAAWIKDDGSHTTTDTLRITANHSPLWQTLRGGN